MSQPPPSAPPPPGRPPHAPPVSWQRLQRPRWSSGLLVLIGLGFLALAASEVMALIAYSRGSFVVVRAGQYQHGLAALGWFLGAVACWVAAARD